jgi:hypothetical protein
MTWSRSLRAFVLTIAVTVTGCGGGGGSAPAGASGSGATVGSPPPVAASGLVPVAPTPGATLYADAAPLRVLRAGAVWTYRGIDKPDGENAIRSEVYANTVTHAAAAAGVVEHGTRPFNSDSETTPIRYERGAYLSTSQIAFSENAPPQTVDIVELRSPVKVNDQYVSVDKHIDDSGVDVDGDNVNDALDVAIYSTVVGEETLDLPNRRQVKAVRVDMHLRARATASKTKTTTPVYDAVQSTWYAPGLGVVKTRVEEPNVNVVANHVITEILENWDGVTEGLGHTPTVDAMAPAGSSSPGLALQYLLGAVGFDTHAVAVGFIPGEAQVAGLAVAQLDVRGNVVANRRYTAAELFPFTQYFAEPRVLRVGNEVRIFSLIGSQELWMVSLDSTGQNIVRPAVRLASDMQSSPDADRISYSVASDDAGIWVGWLRITPGGSSYTMSILAQHFDANGQVPGAVNTVVPQFVGNVFRFSMALDGNQLAFTWLTMFPDSVWHLTTLDTGSGTRLSDQTLGPTVADCQFIQPVALRPGLAITCSSRSGTGIALLDANGNPVLPPGASLATNMLQVPWLPSSGGAVAYKGGGGQLIVNLSQYGKFWPEDTNESNYGIVYATSGTGSPAARETNLLARIEKLPYTLEPVKVGNHLLLVGDDLSGTVTTTMVWLPN